MYINFCNCLFTMAITIFTCPRQNGPVLTMNFDPKKPSI